MKVIVGISNRHIHLKKEHIDILFGDNYQLNHHKDTKQFGEYAALETVTIKTDKDEIRSVRVMGPIRDYTQIEISRTDAYKLGLNPPIRNSGDVKNSAPITVIGPKNEIKLNEGCIIPTRHIHISPKQKELYGLTNYDKVNIRINGEKSGIMSNVYLKVQENTYFELHLDTDDANAFNIKKDNIVDIIEGNNYDI